MALNCEYVNSNQRKRHPLSIRRNAFLNQNIILDHCGIDCYGTFWSLLHVKENLVTFIDCSFREIAHQLQAGLRCINKQYHTLCRKQANYLIFF